MNSFTIQENYLIYIIFSESLNEFDEKSRLSYKSLSESVPPNCVSNAFSRFRTSRDKYKQKKNLKVKPLVKSSTIVKSAHDLEFLEEIEKVTSMNEVQLQPKGVVLKYSLFYFV